MDRNDVIALSNSYANGEERGKLKTFFSDFNQMRTNRRTIVFSTPSETGTSFFRIFEPMLAMYRVTDEFNLVYTEKLTPMLIELADLVVAHRAGIEHDQLHSVVRYFQREKIKPVVVHNVDDNEFNLPASHPMKDMWITAKKDKMSLRSIRESDFIETTTNKLVNTFKQYNRNVALRRNRFNWNLPQWNLDDSEKKRMFGDKLVIGWCGLTSHFQDLVKMKPILKSIQDKYPFVHIVLAGMAIADKKYEVERDPKTGREIIKESEVDNPAETYRERVKSLYGDLDQERLSILDAVGLEEYGKFYSWMDIGIAYIEHNGFNACKCLVSGSLVPTNNGIFTIDSIPSNGLSTDRGDSIVANISYKDERCVRLVTENGYEIEGTISHRIKDKNGVWINFETIQIGDTVSISPFEIKQTEYQKMIFPMLINKYENVNIEDGIELDESKFDEKSMPTITVTERWGELIGLFLGDGHHRMGGNFSIALNKRDDDMINYIESLLFSVGLKAKNSTESRSDCVYVNFNSKSLSRIFMKYGILRKDDGSNVLQKNFEVPEVILKSPKNVIASFLRGLFEADGTISDSGTSISLSTKSKKLAQQVQFLLLGFEIKSKVATRSISGNEYFEVRMHKKSAFLFTQHIGLISKFKTSRAKKNNGKKISNNGDDWDWKEVIVGKTYTQNDVFDIEVENTHEYNSNGFVSHNSEIKVVEYNRYGAPVIYSNFGGYRDYHAILSDNKVLDEEFMNRMACSQEFDKEWIEKIAFWVELWQNDRAEFDRIGQRLKTFVSDYYHIDNYIHEQIHFYNDLVDEKREKEFARIDREFAAYEVEVVR